MKREFVHLSDFDKQWKELGLGDNELAELQLALSESPKSAPVIQGASGVRKVRFATKNRGKSASVRVLYVDLEKVCIVILISAYAKSEKENIEKDETAKIKTLIDKLKDVYSGGRYE